MILPPDNETDHHESCDARRPLCKVGLSREVATMGLLLCDKIKEKQRCIKGMP